MSASPPASLKTRSANAPIRLFTLLAAAATLTACDVVVGGIEGWEARARASETWTRSYDLRAGGAVEVTNVNGRITVIGSEGSRVEVRAEKIAKAGSEASAKDALAELEIIEEAAPESIRLTTKHPRGWQHRGWEVKYELRVPRGARVRLHTVNGGIDVEGVTGGVLAQTTNGGVDGRKLANAVEARATNGGIRVDLDALSEGPVELKTTNGGITLTLPQTARADISASCTNGGIGVSGLDVEELEKSRRRLDARLNGGGARVRLQTTNGGIRIGAS